jgi:hypothetical protein
VSEPMAADIETLLRRALQPVEPPEDLVVRLETTLQSLTELAAEELEGWELGAMRDPRNWVRPVAAVAIGTAAGGALVILRVRMHGKRRKPANVGELAERTLHEVRRILPRR